MCQHDSRHVDVLVKDLGLEQGNFVQTPATHCVTEEEPELLAKQQMRIASCKMFEDSGWERGGGKFLYGRMVEEVTTYSDWAGCEETLGRHTHTLKAYARMQLIIARSRAEAELCH